MIASVGLAPERALGREVEVLDELLRQRRAALLHPAASASRRRAEERAAPRRRCGGRSRGPRSRASRRRATREPRRGGSRCGPRAPRRRPSPAARARGRGPARGSPAASTIDLTRPAPNTTRRRSARERAPGVAEAARVDLERRPSRCGSGRAGPAVRRSPGSRAARAWPRARPIEAASPGRSDVEVRVDARGQVPPAAVEARHHARREVAERDHAGQQHPAEAGEDRQPVPIDPQRQRDQARARGSVGVRRSPGREHNVITSRPRGARRSARSRRGSAARGRRGDRRRGRARRRPRGNRARRRHERGGRVRRAQAADRARRHGDRRGRRVRVPAGARTGAALERGARARGAPPCGSRRPPSGSRSSRPWPRRAAGRRSMRRDPSPSSRCCFPSEPRGSWRRGAPGWPAPSSARPRSTPSSRSSRAAAASSPFLLETIGDRQSTGAYAGNVGYLAIALALAGVVALGLLLERAREPARGPARGRGARPLCRRPRGEPEPHGADLRPGRRRGSARRALPPARGAPPIAGAVLLSASPSRATRPCAPAPPRSRRRRAWATGTSCSPFAAVPGPPRSR